MKTDKITFSIRINIGNYGENISITETISLPDNGLDDNKKESDKAYKQLVKSCLDKGIYTVKALGRFDETKIFQNLDINSFDDNVEQPIHQSVVIPQKTEVPIEQQLKNIQNNEAVNNDWLQDLGSFNDISNLVKTTQSAYGPPQQSNNYKNMDVEIVDSFINNSVFSIEIPEV